MTKPGRGGRSFADILKATLDGFGTIDTDPTPTLGRLRDSLQRHRPHADYGLVEDKYESACTRYNDALSLAREAHESRGYSTWFDDLGLQCRELLPATYWVGRTPYHTSFDSPLTDWNQRIETGGKLLVARTTPNVSSEDAERSQVGALIDALQDRTGDNDTQLQLPLWADAANDDPSSILDELPNDPIEGTKSWMILTIKEKQEPNENLPQDKPQRKILLVMNPHSRPMKNMTFKLEVEGTSVVLALTGAETPDELADIVGKVTAAARATNQEATKK